MGSRPGVFLSALIAVALAEEGTAMNKLRTMKKRKPDFPRSGYEWEDPEPVP